MMNKFVFAAAAWLLLGAIGHGAAAPKTKAKPGPVVLVIADAWASMPESLRARPDHPVPYIIMGKMERALGTPVAGEPQPDPAAVEQELVKILASLGYVRTEIGGPAPALAFLVSWGTANAAIDEFEETDPTTGASSTTSVFHNRREIMQLVGADKAARHLLMSSEADELNEAARDDRVYLFIAAFDAQALAKKQMRLFWRTRISIPSSRHSLPDSLAVMFRSAAPYFARSLDKPVFVDDLDRRKTSVEIGTPVVVPDEPAQPADAKKAKR